MICSGRRAKSGHVVSPIRDSHLIGEIPIFGTAVSGTASCREQKERTTTTMRFVALIALAAGLAGFAGSAQAQSADAPTAAQSTSAPKAVVELFTSQGCSSCPAADALLEPARQARRHHRPLAVGRLLGLPRLEGYAGQLQIQRAAEAYAKALGDGMVYTPQVVVNGVVHVNGSDEGKIARRHRQDRKSIGRLARAGAPVDRERTSWWSRSAPRPQGAAAKEATLWLAVIATSVEVPITRGENKGKTVTYSNVVRELMPIGMWNGKPMTVQLERHSFMQPARNAAPCWCSRDARARSSARR